jgi:hypothetical protein
MYDDLPMSLPADLEEMRRLKIQHLAIKKLVGDALDDVIEARLAPSLDGRRKQVLDVRTQSGVWYVFLHSSSFSKLGIGSPD